MSFKHAKEFDTESAEFAAAGGEVFTSDTSGDQTAIVHLKDGWCVFLPQFGDGLLWHRKDRMFCASYPYLKQFKERQGVLKPLADVFFDDRDEARQAAQEVLVVYVVMPKTELHLN